MNTTLEILRRARERLSDPARWTQGAYARDADGFTTAMYDDDAVCWCLVGAISKETNILNLPWYGDGEKAVNFLSKQVSTLVSEFNDTHTHGEVLALLDRAIRGSLIDFNDTHSHEEVLELIDKAIANLSESA